MHYYQFHIGDFRGSTMHLSNEEDLAYRRLIDWYYDTEAPIPIDTHMVSRRLRVGKDSIDSVLSDFFYLDGDGWRHDRCDLEISRYQDKAQKNRENGKKGGRPPNKINPVGSQSVPIRNPLESGSNPNQQPTTNNQQPEVPPLSPLVGKQKRATKIPETFLLTPDMRAWAADKAPAINIREETENFVDYWRGAGKTKADWVATWRTWMRKAQKDAVRAGGYKPANKQQQVEESNARVVQEIIARESGFSLGDPIAIDGEVIHVD